MSPVLHSTADRSSEQTAHSGDHKINHHAGAKRQAHVLFV